MRVPPNALFIRENPIKMDDLGVPLFQETSKSVVPVWFCYFYELNQLVIVLS